MSRPTERKASKPNSPSRAKPKVGGKAGSRPAKAAAKAAPARTPDRREPSRKGKPAPSKMKLAPGFNPERAGLPPGKRSSANGKAPTLRLMKAPSKNGAPANGRSGASAARASAKTARRAKNTAPSADPALVAYESEVLSVLAAEPAGGNRRQADAEIRRRLRDKQLGSFDRTRVESLRSFKKALADEIHLGSSSSYFSGSHGLYANPEDFDHARLAEDFVERFPGISHEAIAAFIPIAVYYYYLR